MARLPAIAICDDDAKANQQTLQLIQYYEQLYPENQSVVYQFYSAQELLANEEQINLLFLDIELGGASGVELVPVMKEKFPGITLIFVSSHTKYFIHTTRLGVFQFLTKPLDQMIFFEELDRFFYRCYQNQLLYTLENKEGAFQFPVMEVMYISSSIHQLVVHHIAGAHKKRGQLSSRRKTAAAIGVYPLPPELSGKSSLYQGDTQLYHIFAQSCKRRSGRTAGEQKSRPANQSALL